MFKPGLAEVVICNHLTVNKCIKRIEERQSILNLPRPGLKRIYTEADDPRLLRIYKSNEKQTALELQQEWHIDAGPNMIRRRVKEQGIKSYSTIKKPWNIQQRLEICNKYPYIHTYIIISPPSIFGDDIAHRVLPFSYHLRPSIHPSLVGSIPISLCCRVDGCIIESR